MIELFHPDITQAEIAAVAETMRSGWIGKGPRVDEFERAWAKHIGVSSEHVVSLNCATEALFHVMQWLEDNNDMGSVIVPSIGYIGTANAVIDSNLDITLCDVNAHTLNPTLADIHRVSYPHTLAAVIQPYGGTMVGMQDIISDLNEREIFSIIDLACGPTLPVYDADFAVWSFDAMKVMTAGDGAMLYCRDADVAKRIRTTTMLGMDKASGQSSDSVRWWEFQVHDGGGRRSIMNDIQASIGLVQLGRLGEMVKRRQAIWDHYNVRLSPMWQPEMTWLMIPLEEPAGVQSSYYTYWVQTAHADHRDALAAYLRARDIYTSFRYWPIHMAYGWPCDSLPNSTWAARHTLNLPLHSQMTDADVERVCDTIIEFGRTLK